MNLNYTYQELSTIVNRTQDIREWIKIVQEQTEANLSGDKFSTYNWGVFCRDGECWMWTYDHMSHEVSKLWYLWVKLEGLSMTFQTFLDKMK